jgi:cytidyltransferase-like protein
MQTIGIFGGTFDPPHLGHLILAAEAYTQLRLDRLLWVLTPDPPHKRGQSITLLKSRQAMIRLPSIITPSLNSQELIWTGPVLTLHWIQ